MPDDCKGAVLWKRIIRRPKKNNLQISFSAIKKILLCAYMEDTEKEEKSVKISHISVNEKIWEKL